MGLISASEAARRLGVPQTTRALLSLYLNLTPFILSLVFIAPLVVWLGWV